MISKFFELDKAKRYQKESLLFNFIKANFYSICEAGFRKWILPKLVKSLVFGALNTPLSGS